MDSLLRREAVRQLTLEPIGYVRCALATKVEAARQPRASGGAAGTIELLPGRNFEHALEDLAEWQYLWVLYWFDRNEGWRPKVLPPSMVLAPPWSSAGDVTSRFPSNAHAR